MPYLIRHVLDLDVLPGGVNVTDLDVSSSSRGNIGLLGYLCLQPRPFALWFTRLGARAGTLLTRSRGQLQPEGKTRIPLRIDSKIKVKVHSASPLKSESCVFTH